MTLAERGRMDKYIRPRIENCEMFIDIDVHEFKNIHGSGYFIHKGLLVKSYEASSVNHT